MDALSAFSVLFAVTAAVLAVCAAMQAPMTRRSRSALLVPAAVMALAMADSARGAEASMAAAGWSAVLIATAFVSLAAARRPSPERHVIVHRALLSILMAGLLLVAAPGTSSAVTGIAGAHAGMSSAGSSFASPVSTLDAMLVLVLGGGVAVCSGYCVREIVRARTSRTSRTARTSRTLHTSRTPHTPRTVRVATIAASTPLAHRGGTVALAEVSFMTLSVITMAGMAATALVAGMSM
ncbi:hypothetical protein [Subtercola endophyticus]|uniref:hypothetical protein n=1 Tax=Subtercola endophyticus TaxID=2895559 RepID=UPI001E5A7F01|nr:hypothetical protein [Subtercola endophyticus]UFS58671.1 hypothetical protein LQ955_16995 [Subtercola endophyticus]